MPIEDHDGVRFDGSDIKVPYELSRLQFLPILGKAYVVTGDERYRENAKRLLSDWMTNNPVGIGVNWSIAMEAALRAMSICFLLNLVSPLRPEEQSWLHTVTRCLWHHLLYIEAHSEFSHLVSSNHYLSSVVGLYCLAEFLDGRGMPARRRAYRQRVESEILRQVYKDGGDYELSPPGDPDVYQLAVVDAGRQSRSGCTLSPAAGAYVSDDGRAGKPLRPSTSGTAMMDGSNCCSTTCSRCCFFQLLKEILCASSICWAWGSASSAEAVVRPKMPGGMASRKPQGLLRSSPKQIPPGRMSLSFRTIDGQEGENYL